MVLEKGCICSFVSPREGQGLPPAGEAPELLLLITPLGQVPGSEDQKQRSQSSIPTVGLLPRGPYLLPDHAVASALVAKYR